MSIAIQKNCLPLIVPCLIALGACAKGSDASRDTAAAPAATGGANANPIDTGMTARPQDSAGMAHDSTTHRAASGDSSTRTQSRQ
jgi:hypothetical protein